MFAAGDLVVYGGEGVCRIESIGPSGMSYDSGDRMYYHLALIQSLPSLPLCKPEMPGLRAAKDHYHRLVQRCECSEMAALIHTICRRRAWAVRHGKKVSQMDERYLKRAEEQLYGEMAAALDMAREEIVPFIRETWPQWPERLPETEI